MSGGEIQRIAIARAILKNPKILILDEGTSALDSSNESIIKGEQPFYFTFSSYKLSITTTDELEKLMEDKCVIIIAHRLSTTKKANTIYVMKSGGIVEEGTHEQLFSKKGIYYTLFQNQFPKEN